ncbi:MAG: hypothetical protein IJW79_06325 [Clostridia bacterium]|nr:hypothetical protein [Clostridia bacterium]
MKKLICTVLALAMIIGSVFAFAACKEEKKVIVEAPDGYTVYDNDDISFAYPEGWTVTEGSVVVIVNPTGIGNNITVAYSAASDVYEKMDLNSFNELLAPQLIASGLPVNNPTVEQLENAAGVKITKIHYDTNVSGIDMAQTMYALNANSKSYVVTVTETEADPVLVQTVFETLKK